MTKNSAYIFSSQGIKSPKGGFLAFSTAPYQHQLQCLAEFGDRRYFALLAEMGTGKTWIAINNYAYLLAKGEVQNMLVVAPNGVQWNWVKNELPKHLPQQLQSKVAWAGFSGGMRKAEQEAVKSLLEHAGVVPSVLCVNWTALSHQRTTAIVKQFLAANPDVMVVLDESDYCKNPGTKIAKAVQEILAPAAKYRRIMTGTPITNSPFDAWTQFNFLSTGILNCNSYIAFKRRHGVFLPANHPIVRSIQGHQRGAILIPAKDAQGRALYQNLDKLTEAIAPVSFRVQKSDCLDLPPKVYTNLYVDLTPTQRRVYDLACKESIMELQDEAEPITSKIAILTYLCQLTGNHYSTSLLSLGQSSEVDPAHNPKLERALELAQAVLVQGQQLIIWARYRAEIQDLIKGCEVRGLPAVSYYGDTNQAARQEAIAAFEDGTAKVFIANPQSAGTGLTLVAASVVLYYSNSFSLHDRLQSEDRCHRIGQQRTVEYINLMARDTIDEHITAVLSNKQDVAASITGLIQSLK